MYTDNVKKQVLNGLRDIKIHGHVALTLRDAKSGKIVRHEEADNTITPAIANIFEKNLAGTIDFTKILPIYQKLLGGVCLWSGEISDTNDVFLPSETSNSVTAHAGQNTYDQEHGGAADDLARGIPNSNLSEEIISSGEAIGWKHVWTWDTSQGNGPIRALTLTHADTGDCGTGKANLTFPTYSPLAEINSKVITKRYVDNISSYYQKQPFEMLDENTMICYSITDMICSVSVVPIILTKADLLGPVGEGQNDHAESFNVNLSAGTATNINNVRHFFFYNSGTKKLTIGIITASPTNTIYLNEIDLIAKTNTTRTLTLSSQISLNVNTGYRPAHVALNPASDNGIADYIYLYKGDLSTYLKVDIATGTTTDISNPGNVTMDRAWAWSVYLGHNRILMANGHLINNNTVYQCLKDAPALNGWNSRDVMMNIVGADKFKPLLWLSGMSGSYYFDCPYPSAVLNKMYAASVYNLASVITKTSAQTMQVEYSITISQS